MDKRSSRRWIIVTRRTVDNIGRRRTVREGYAPSAISVDEWLLHVAADPALERVRLAANENEALRDAHPVRVVDRGTDRWLYWMGGELWVTMPDAAMLTTVRRVARSLGAHVVDEDDAWLRPSPRGRGERERPGVRRIVSPRTQGLPSGDPIDRSDHRRGRAPLHRFPGRDGAVGTESGREDGQRGNGASGQPDQDATEPGSGAGVDPDDPDRLCRRVHEEALVERQARQALIVAGTVACVASVMWLMQA